MDFFPLAELKLKSARFDHYFEKAALLCFLPPPFQNIPSALIRVPTLLFSETFNIN